MRNTTGIAAIVGFVSLSACGPGVSETSRIGPEFLGNVWERELITPPFYCTSVHGTGPDPWPETGVLVGYSDYYEPGTEPFPCREKIDYAYRGAVRFDLTGLPGLITSAILHSRLVSTTYPQYGIGSSMSCVDSLGIAVDDWTQPDYRNFFPAEDLVSFDGNGTIDVTSTAIQWQTSRRENFGFILVGKDESFADKTEVCLSVLDDFVLEVQTLHISAARTADVVPERIYPVGVTVPRRPSESATDTRPSPLQREVGSEYVPFTPALSPQHEMVSAPRLLNTRL